MSIRISFFTNLFLRHRIVAARVPGVTAQDPSGAEIAPTEDAESRDRLPCVFRTGGIESTKPKRQNFPQESVIQGKCFLVENDTKKKYPLHMAYGIMEIITNYSEGFYWHAETAKNNFSKLHSEPGRSV